MNRPLIIALVALTGLTMSYEAGGHYASYYPSEPWRGYLLAGLAELFLGLSLAFNLPDRRWLRRGFRVLGLLLFVVVVAGAAAPGVIKGLEDYQSADLSLNRRTQLSSALVQIDRDLNRVEGQKRNTALLVQRRQMLQDQLLGESKPQGPGRAQALALLILALVLRFSIQAANALLSHSLAGGMKAITTKKQPVERTPQTVLDILRNQGAQQVKRLVVKD